MRSPRLPQVSGSPRRSAERFEEVIIRLGNRHERAHLKGFNEVVDLSGGTFEDREQRTREEVSRGAPVIYQPVLRSEVDLSGIRCEVVGEPDFLVRQSGGYAIRDSKLARRINERDHPEIIAQVGLYGWLFEACFGTPPRG